MNMIIERVLAPTPEVHTLVGELDDVLGMVYQPHQRHGLSIARLFEPHVRFFVARLDGLAAGCGGIALFDGYAEVKRMYTRPGARSRGVAKAVLRRIEEEARAAAKPLLRLETGTSQHEAIGLYQSVGFRPCGAFGDYAAMPAERIETSLFYEKTLAGSSPLGLSQTRLEG